MIDPGCGCGCTRHRRAICRIRAWPHRRCPSDCEGGALRVGSTPGTRGRILVVLVAAVSGLVVGTLRPTW